MAKLFGDLKVKGGGERAGSATAAQLTATSTAAKAIKFRAKADNAGYVYVANWTTGVTVPAATTDATSGWPIGPGEETDWFPCENLDDWYFIGDNAGDDFSYIYLN